MPPESFDEADWRERLQTHRRRKDEFFAEDPESPISDVEQEDFDGLAYFSPDASFRFEARYEAFETAEEVRLGATRGPDLEYLRVGTVGFTAEGDHHVLRAFRAPGVEDILVPFRDETNGNETWQHGRYLSLDFDAGADHSSVVLDFNLAYHPFCVYADTHVSAIPPTENRLPFAVRAGERL